MGMSVFEFGEQKLAMGDIDPLYNAVWKAEWPMERVSRYILAFVAFDLAGLAGRVVDRGAKQFWHAMHEAVDQTKRGQPRRYYRGDKAHASLNALETRYGTAEKALFALEGSYAEHALPEVAAHWPGWGPTAAWKIADMAERCRGAAIDFSDFTTEQLISNDMIRKGCQKATGLSQPDAYRELIAKMLKHNWKADAPGIPGKKVGAQEIETILCYYSHDWKTNKHMPGMDKENIRAELRDMPSKAGALLEKML